MFRNLKHFTCYDEPFNPKLETHLPNQHHKGTWDEFISLWENDNDAFLKKLSAIDLNSETNPLLHAKGIGYLRYLSDQPTVIDFTRLNFKVDDVLPQFPDAIAVFLYRSPIAFTTSHLINSENRKFLRQRYYRSMFFTSVIGFDSWGLDTNFKSLGFGNLVEQSNITPVRPLSKLTSAEKVLLYWLVTRRISQNYINSDKSGRSFAVSYEDIIDGTSGDFDRAVELAGIDPDQLETSHLRRYSLGFKQYDPVWDTLAHNVGFSREEMVIYLRQTAR